MSYTRKRSFGSEATNRELGWQKRLDDPYKFGIIRAQRHYRNVVFTATGNYAALGSMLREHGMEGSTTLILKNTIRQLIHIARNKYAASKETLCILYNVDYVAPHWSKKVEDLIK
jgi:hypothetical protein